MAELHELASIVIPHYRTEELARLCLRSIRKLSDPPYEVIVVDNNSGDASLEYLRRVSWIRLIERGPETEPDAVRAHATAMDIGTAAATGKWLVSLHTDTIVQRPGWLGEMIARLQSNPKAAALGAGKIDTDPGWYRAMKRCWDTQRMKQWARRAAGLPPNPRLERRPWYPRSYCAVYRLDLVQELGLSWQASQHCVAGEMLFRRLVEAGYDGIELASEEMRRYVEHVSHATAYVGRGGIGHWRGNQKVRRAMARIMNTELARQLMSDDSLDR